MSETVVRPPDGWLQAVSRRLPIGGASHRWHAAINAHARAVDRHSMRWMYDARDAADELPRIAHLFGLARAGKLFKTHRQCSLSAPEPVPENHLTCCLGVRCDECPHLAAIEAADLTDVEKDTAKAWTCVAHVLNEGGDPAREGYILTVDDQMYWSHVYESLAAGMTDPEGGEDG